MNAFTAAFVAASVFCLSAVAARGAPPASPVHLQNKASGLCLDKTAGLKNGVPTRISQCRKGDPNQRFKIEKQRNEFVLIRSISSGKCLGLAHEGRQNGVPVHQWSCLGYDNQLWKMIALPGGWFALKTKHSDKCLTVAGAGKKNVAALHQRDCAGAKDATQLFRIVP